MKKATLHDVARLAGVSAGTVSKYINGKAIGEKTNIKFRMRLRDWIIRRVRLHAISPAENLTR